MSKLGDLLKSEREKKGLSLQEIGMSLKINAKVLRAIEDGDEKNFPAKTFMRGFVKSYAQYLRLDTNQVLQLFQEEFGSTRPEEPKKPEVPGAPISAGPAASTGGPKYEGSLRRNEDAALPIVANNRIYTIVGAIVLLMLIAFVAKMMDKYQKESRVSKSEVIAAVEGETQVPAVSPETTVETSVPTTTSGPTESSTSTIPSTTLAAVAVTTSTLKATTTTTTSSTSTTAKITTTTVTTTTQKPNSTTSTTLAGATTSTTLKSRNTEVIVEALSKVSVKFSLNDGKSDSIELSPDQVHTFRSRGLIQLEISDGGAVNIIVNGRDRGVPGTIGKPTKLTYP